MANKPTQPLFPLGLETSESSNIKGFNNSGTIEHSPGAVMTFPEDTEVTGLPSSVRYNPDSDEFEGYYENGGWLSLGGGGIRWETLPHAPSSNLLEGRGYLINNTTGTSTVVLPSPTRIGDSVTICDAYGKFATYPLTVSPSGNNLYGSTEDMAITTDNVSATFTWSGPEQGWVITSGVGLGQGRVYSREIFTQILASETSAVTLNTPPTIVDVYADGKRLAESKYSLDGNVITFSPSLPANTELQVIEYTPIQLGNGSGSGSSTITWVYNGGSAIGGETEITLDIVVDDVPAIDINGSRQYKNLGFTFDPLTSKITLAQELDAEDEVVVIINGTPNIYNQIDYTLREVARVTNVKDTEVIYFSVGAVLSGYKVIYDKVTQRSYFIPELPTGTTAVSLSSSAVLVHSAGSVDLGALAVSREEYVTLSGTFDSGAVINVKNELLTHTDGKYRWDGTLPKTVAPGSTPATTGGVGVGAWISVGDASLRTQLANGNGSLIGVHPHGTLNNVLTVRTPEQYNAVGDGIADDTSKLKEMLSDINNVPETLPDAAAVNSYMEKVAVKINLTKLYRFTETLYIPPGVSIEMPAPNFFTRECKQGLFYDPVDKNTAAISLMVYRKQPDGSYKLNKDVDYYPTGLDIDNGDAVTCARKIDISNLNLITAPGVKVGVKWIGGAGCTTKGLSIGENTGSDITTARLPRVGLLQSASWGSVHENLRILYKTQGAVFIESNGGAAVNNAYISRLGNTNGELEQAVYKPAGFTEVGDVAVTQFAGSEVKFNSPIIEQASFDFVHAGRDTDSYGLFMVDKPHIESSGGKKKHSFYLINTSSDVTLSGVGLSGQDPDLDSMYFLKNCPETARNVVRGQMPVSGVKLVRGTGNYPTLVLDCTNMGSQFQFGEVGDIFYIKDVVGVKADTLYIDPVNGNNYNWGTNGTKPIRELTNIAKICQLFRCKSVYLNAGESVITSNTELPMVVFEGPGSLKANSGSSFLIKAGGTLSLIGLSGISTDGGHMFRVSTGEKVNIHTNCSVNAGAAYVVLSEVQGNIEYRQLFYSVNCSKYIGATAGQTIAGVMVKTATRPTGIDAAPVDGNVSLSYKIIES